MKKLIIIGAGGYAQEVLWVVDDINEAKPAWEFYGFVDPGQPERRGQVLYDRPIIGGWDDIPANEELFFACGIGDPLVRRKECDEAERRGLRPATIVHPSVITARHVTVGEGSIVGPGCVLAPYSATGRHCALNIGVTIGHNSRLGDFCVLSPGSQVLGAVDLGDQVFLGANATVYLGRKVGPRSTIGANSFLLTNLAEGVSVIGVPAARFSVATGAGICTNQETKLKKRKGE